MRNKKKEHRACCPRDCYDSCSFVVTLDSLGQISHVRGEKDHPVTRGFLCPRGAKEKAHLSRNRVLFPSINTKTGRERVSWEQAMAAVAGKIRETLENHGPGALLHLDYAGNGGLLSSYFPQRLWNALDFTGTDYAICNNSGLAAISLHYGKYYGIQPDEVVSRKLVVFWGFNSAVCAPHLWHRAREAQKKGALIVTVDPRFSETSQQSDFSLSINPGSDVALAYGIAREIIVSGTADTSFLSQHTEGFEAFREEAMKWPPERVARFCGTPIDAVMSLAEAYCERRPSATLIGIGMQKTLGGSESVRGLALIPPLLGLPRGFFFSNSSAHYIDYPSITGERQRAGEKRITSQVSLARGIRDGNFKFLFISTMNPAVTLPDSKAFLEGISREDVFTVVMETHHTLTSQHADVILPSAAHFEKDDLMIPWSHRFVRFSPKFLTPPGEGRTEVEVMRELAGLLGCREEWLFEDPLECLRNALSGAFVTGTFDDLLAGKLLELSTRGENEFQTPSGKLEFYSQEALRQGFSPLPRQPELKEQAFTLLNSAHRLYTHTQFQEVFGPIPPMVTLHPDDGMSHGIKEGDTVRLSNAQGSLVVKVTLSPGQRRGTLWIAHHAIDLEGNPLNTLTSTEPQEIGRGPTFNSTEIEQVSLQTMRFSPREERKTLELQEAQCKKRLKCQHRLS
ncbi:MAG: molybdopterin-dependent oxidoreductase [Candidatus Eremiobacteraeota bacterium]|nr:molybdopterin-dependent oxidoreductase [Candidatus Eremiobacteraeota bacterium]